MTDQRAGLTGHRAGPLQSNTLCTPMLNTYNGTKKHKMHEHMMTNVSRILAAKSSKLQKYLECTYWT